MPQKDSYDGEYTCLLKFYIKIAYLNEHVYLTKKTWRFTQRWQRDGIFPESQIWKSRDQVCQYLSYRL